MKLIVWLGNPGKKYENTRHNVGFLVVEHMQKYFKWSEWEDSKFQALLSKTSLFTLVKPMTFMNLSGDAVASIVNFYKLDPGKDILIISDDLDMEFAKVRYREKWSHGGQNGQRDIIAKLGTDEFARIKIGIGRHEKYEVSDWVLSKFQKEEREILESEVFLKVEEYIKKWLWDSM
jgi:peptidyl-tRNA hydrolase, PTH1 family